MRMVPNDLTPAADNVFPVDTVDGRQLSFLFPNRVRVLLMDLRKLSFTYCQTNKKLCRTNTELSSCVVNEVNFVYNSESDEFGMQAIESEGRYNEHDTIFGIKYMLKVENTWSSKKV